GHASTHDARRAPHTRCPFVCVPRAATHGPDTVNAMGKPQCTPARSSPSLTPAGCAVNYGLGDSG
ncbi:MAG: hypothetical protein ACK5T7_13115, partial [Gemmatimonas sp.]